MKKRVALLGSTGFVGRQALDVIANFSENMEICALSARSQIDLLSQQVNKFRPSLVCVYDNNHQNKIFEHGIKNIVIGQAGLLEIVAHPKVDIVIIAIPGMDSLVPSWGAIEASKKVALASKETFVAAGQSLVNRATETGATILPVDRELSAIWQCLRGEDVQNSVRGILLTCSGGPFRGLTNEQLHNVRVLDALKHPNWSMGKKVSIDSATLINKDFEIISSHYLFNISLDNIDVIFHPESIIHSMVEFVDGNIKALIGSRDMKLFIQYALSYPERKSASSKPFSWSQLTSLSFEPLDTNTFPLIKIADEVGRLGSTYPAVFSSADDEAVKLFLDGLISFKQITETITRVIEKHQPVSGPQIIDILEVDRWAKNQVHRMIEAY